MRRAVAAVLAAGLWLTSAACSAEIAANPPSTAPTATDPSTTTTSGTPTTSGPATTTPGEVKAPVMPALARENTRAGAKAFVRHFVDTLNYGYLTGDAGAASEIAAPDCAVCNALTENIRRIHRRGGGQVGGEWTVTRLDPLASGDRSELIFVGRVEIAKGSTRATRHSATKPIRPKTDYFEFHVSWSGSTWQASDLRPG